MINLDTNIVIAALEGRLRADEQRALDDVWCISDMVLAELGRLARERRVRFDLYDRDVAAFLRRTTIWPVDLRVAHALRQLDFRSDPVDEVIAATSLVYDIPLVTRDTRILASKIVPLAIR